MFPVFRDGFSMGGMSQDFLGDDFKSQGSHVPYSVTDFSTQGAQGYPGSFLNHHSQAGYSRFGAGNDFMSQDYMAHGSQGLFTQAGFNDPSQDDNSIQSQNLINPLYSRPFDFYNSQPLNMQSSQQQPPQQQQVQGSQNQKLHYNG